MSASPRESPGAGEQGDRAIDIDRAQGLLVGDYGFQVNRFMPVTAGRDAFMASGDMHFHAGDAGRTGPGAIPEELRPAGAAIRAESRVFVGRDADLAKLLRLLDPAMAGTAPRVTVVSGMAGVGKTELALHAAHAAFRNGWFPGGVLFAQLPGDDLESARTALDGFLSAIGIDGDVGPADPQARWRLFSARVAQYAEAGLPLLVVIDSAVSARQCELLLPAGGQAVITSRDKLTALRDSRLLQLRTLGDEDGADLLTEQVGVTLDTDARVAGHRDDAREIAMLCGGLPLALRIVAAILTDNEARSLTTVAADLRDARTRLDELRQEDGDEAIQVRTAFDVSYRRLPPERAQVFRLLALNPGPDISTTAAVALANLDERAVRHHLEGLAKTHLIEPSGDDGVRWRMHDLIRLYAAEEEPAGAGDAWARLMVYYMNTANAATQYLAPGAYHPAKRTFAGRPEALTWLDREYPNLAAIGLLPIAGPMFADIALGLWRYFELRRRINDGIALTGHAMAIARELGDHGREARAHTNLAALFRQARMFDSALTAGQAAVDAYRSEGSQEGLGIALNNLASAQLAAGQFEEATATGREAAVVFQSLEDRHREGIALSHIASALQATGQLTESIAAYQDVLAAMREANDRRGEGGVLLNLGWALQEDGQPEEAIAAERQAAGIFAELGDRANEGSALNNLGSVLYEQNRPGEAIDALRRAIDALAEAGEVHTRGGVLVNLGMTLVKDGRCNDAAASFTDSVADYREASDRSGEGTAREGLGIALACAGRPEEAAQSFRAAAEIFRETGDRLREGITLDLLGRFLPKSGQGEAVAAFERAVTVFQELGEAKRESSARSGLLGRQFSAPSSRAEMRARVKDGSAVELTPGVWMQFHVLGEEGDEKGRIAKEIAEDFRAFEAKMRQAAGGTAGKTARKQPRKTSRKDRRRGH